MERISAHQFMTLGSSVLMGGTFLLIATFVTEAGGRDGWMSIMPAFALTIPYGIMVLSLSARYPEKNLLDISGIIFGKWTGKIIGSLYIVISGYYGGLLLAFIGIIYEQSIMPLVPRWVLYLGGLLLVFYLASTGIEVFARFSEVLLPVIVVALVFNIVLTVPRIEQNELLPFFENGVKPLLWGALKVIPFPMVYSMFLAGIITFLPQNNQQEISQFKTGIWRAAFLVGILNTIVVLSQILVFGPRETIRLSFGILELGKMVEISRTVAGVESLFMGVWLGALVIKCCAFFYMTTWGLETVLNLKGIKWRLLLCAAFLGIAFGVKKGFYLSTKLSFVESYLIFPFVFVWIPILWITSHWKVKLNTPNKTS